MAFGPSNTTKTAENNLGGISNTALNSQLPMFNAAGTSLFNPGTANVTSGTNFFNTLLNGNRANTAAVLQPSIDQIRGNQAAAMSAINTLMPRGGGRSSTLFQQSFAPQGQIQNLFNAARTNAASTLPSIGLQQIGAGTNLFGLGNQALGAATGANVPLAQIGQQQQQISNNLFSGIGSTLAGLALAPVTGGTSLLGSLFKGGG
jgi:hypothetical protein